jgi:hypothetical protein
MNNYNTGETKRNKKPEQELKIDFDNIKKKKKLQLLLHFIINLELE